MKNWFTTEELLQFSGSELEAKCKAKTDHWRHVKRFGWPGEKTAQMMRERCIAWAIPEKAKREEAEAFRNRVKDDPEWAKWEKEKREYWEKHGKEKPPSEDLLGKVGEMTGIPWWGWVAGIGGVVLVMQLGKRK